jgi:hypothetical protein
MTGPRTADGGVTGFWGEVVLVLQVWYGGTTRRIEWNTDTYVQWKKYDENNIELDVCVVKQFACEKRFEYTGLPGVASEAVYVFRILFLLNFPVLIYCPAINISSIIFIMATTQSVLDVTRTIAMEFSSIGYISSFALI